MCSLDGRSETSTGAIPGERTRASLGEVCEDGLEISCARATRGLRRPSPGVMARLGVPVGGRVRKLRAVEDQSAPIPEERTSKLGGSILETYSFDALS